MRRLLCILLILIWPGAGLAQDSDDRSRLVRLIEDALSDEAARQVRIEGFRGALSSTAQLDRLTIADEDGIWLTLEAATLNWNRTAIFSRALEVTELTAGRLAIARLPEGDTLPDAEAQPFSLPELPLRIQIDEAAIGQVELGPDVLGEALTFSVGGTGQLADGEGEAEFLLTRLDGPEGRIRLDGAFDNETRVLDLDLGFVEGAGGLVATRLGIPGAPAIDLTVAGTGPLSDFTAEINLDTDSEPRLAGQVALLEPEEGGRRVSVDIAGDVTAIFLPEYRDFFGPRIALVAEVVQDPNGALSLDPFHLEAAAMELSGTVFLNTDRQPESFEITGLISPTEAQPGRVRLPIAGAETSVDRVELDVGYNSALGNTWQGRFGIRDLQVDDLSIASTELEVDGVLTEAEQGLARASAEVAMVANGIAHPDEGLAAAFGERAEISASVVWRDGDPVEITGLRAQSGDARLFGELTLAAIDTGLDVGVSATAALADLTRFAAVADQPLSGAAELSLNGTANLPSGGFDIDVEGETLDLRVADGLPPALFAGETTFATSLERDETGLSVESLDLTGQELELEGRAEVASDGSTLDLTAGLRDVGLFTSALSGPVSLEAALAQTGENPWGLTADLAGPGGIALDLAGDVGLEGGAVDLALTGSAPLALADPFIAPRTIRGNLAIDLGLVGPPELANLSGRLTTSGASVAAPTLPISLTDLGAEIDLNGSTAQVAATGVISTGGQVTANGQVGFGGGGLPVNLTIGATNARLLDPALYEVLLPSIDLQMNGDLTGASTVTGTVQVGETEIRIPESGFGGATTIPDITHIGGTAAQRRTRANAGLTGQSSQAGGGNSNIGLDIAISAPGRIFLRGRGVDAELGGTLRVGGTTANVIPDGRFDLIRGRLALLGQRLDLVEGSATLTSNFDPFLRLLAESQAGEFLIQILVSGPASNPEVSFDSVPGLPEDEVLAQLLFGRSISNLSALQALQLADAVAGLAGVRSGPGVFERLRDNLNLDDLDVRTTEDGSAAVRAGRYISDNIYTDVTVGGDGGADVSLNIDLTPNITARGEVSGDGESRLGIFFERDY